MNLADALLIKAVLKQAASRPFLFTADLASGCKTGIRRMTSVVAVLEKAGLLEVGPLGEVRLGLGVSVLYKTHAKELSRLPADELNKPMLKSWRADAEVFAALLAAKAEAEEADRRNTSAAFNSIFDNMSWSKK